VIPSYQIPIRKPGSRSQIRRGPIRTPIKIWVE
jgi:hypothetical protein